MSIESHPHFRVLEAVRGVAAFSVFFVHWSTYFPPTSRNFAVEDWFMTATAALIGLFKGALWNYQSTHPGVILFLILSGFVIHFGTERRGRDLDVAKFYRRRFLRIYPTFAVCLIIGIVVGIPAAILHYGQSVGDFATPKGLAGLLAPFVLIPVFSFNDRPIGDPILMTVMIEMVLYLAYPAIRGIMRRYGIFSLLAGSGALASLHNFDAFDDWFVGDSIYVFQFYWCLGAVSANIVLKRPEICTLSRLYGVAAAIFVGQAAMGLVLGADFMGRERGMLCAVMFAFLVPALAATESRYGIGEIRWLMPLGRISYSLYAIHVPIFTVVFGAFSYLKIPCTAAVAAFGLAVGVGGAWILYACVEAPSHRAARRIGVAKAESIQGRGE